MSIIGEINLNGRHCIFISGKIFTHKMRNKIPKKGFSLNPMNKKRILFYSVTKLINKITLKDNQMNSLIII